MKTYAIFALPILFISLSFLSVSIKPRHAILERFNGDKHRFILLVDSLKRYPTQELFIETRNQYKKLEWLIEARDPAAAKLINGPNLVKPHPEISFKEEIQPTGLQAIEPLFFEDEILDTSELIRLCNIMQSDLQEVTQSWNRLQISETSMLVAARMAVLGAGYKSVTGLDAPVCLNGLNEARIVLQTAKLVIQDCRQAAKPQSLEFADSLLTLFDAAIAYINLNDDFEAFNRFEFLKEFIHPIYGLWFDFHKTSGFALPPLSMRVGHINYEARQPFSPDFINPWAFSRHLKDAGTPESIELGRLLFFDPVLSANGERACASCHRPELAFTDGLPKSLAAGFEGTVSRNAPSVIQAALQTKQLYDGRADYLETQIDHVFYNRKEFSGNYETAIMRLKSSPEYVKLFIAAFPNQIAPAIDGFTITKAIADYVRSLKGFTSKFDQQIRGEIPVDPQITKGFNLFMGKALCGTCHFAPAFNGTVPPYYIDTEFEVIGVPADTLHQSVTDKDLGKYHLQQAPVNKFAFKTPGVRNAALTAPYMHNGVFASLDQVLDFYNKGGGQGLGQDLPNQTLPFDNLNLNREELLAIQSFLMALTDTTGMTGAPFNLPYVPKLNNRIVGGLY